MVVGRWATCPAAPVPTCGAAVLLDETGQTARDPKIRQPEAAVVLIDKNVGRLDVTVHNVHVMQVIEALEDLAGVRDHNLLARWRERMEVLLRKGRV